MWPTNLLLLATYGHCRRWLSLHHPALERATPISPHMPLSSGPSELNSTVSRHQAEPEGRNREAARPSTPADVSNSFSQTLETKKRQNRSGKIIEGTPSKIMGDGSKPVSAIKGSHSPQMLPPQTKLIKAIRMPSRFPSIIQISQSPPKFLR
jgi:hypothetical protein